MAPSSAHGRSLGLSCAKNDQLLSSKPLFDAFDDLVSPVDAVCKVVVVQSSPGESWKISAYRAAPIAINSSSRQPNSNDCSKQQYPCPPPAKMPSAQPTKARSGGMLSSILGPFNKLHKLLKGRSASQVDVTTGTGFDAGSAFTGTPDSDLIDLLDQMEHQWSSTGSSNSSRRSSRRSSSSGSILNPWSRRTSSSSSSSTYTRSGSGSDTPTGSSTQSPRQSLSGDSAYAGGASSTRGRGSFTNTLSAASDQQRQQQYQQQQYYQTKHVYDQEGYGQCYKPMYPNRYQDQDAAAAAESRQLQLARAEQELQDWATASRGWSKDIAGYGPSWGASRQPGSTVGGSGGISSGYSLY